MKRQRRDSGGGGGFVSLPVTMVVGEGEVCYWKKRYQTEDYDHL